MNLMTKRFLIAFAVGIVLTFVDLWITSFGVSNAFDVNGPMFWLVFLSRIVIAPCVAIAGVISFHPIFTSLKMRYLRGAIIGIWLSLGLAVSGFFDPTYTWGIFAFVIISGAIYGVIIDFVAIYFAGDGKKLLDYESEIK